MKKVKTVFILFLLLSGKVIYSQCTYNGQNYPEGSVIGPYTCENGNWVKK